MRKRKIVVIVVIIIIILLFSLIPLEIRVKDKEYAVSHAISLLLSGKNTWIDKKYQPFIESHLVTNESNLFFINGTEISDKVFLDLGLMPKPDDEDINFDDGEIIIVCTYQDTSGQNTKLIQFSYVYGYLGAQGYEINVYRTFLKTFIHFSHLWVS